MHSAKLSVSIPAWNEEEALPAMLQSLLTQEGVTLEIVVVANGCSDQTTLRASEFQDRFLAAGHSFKILEMADASKPAALNVSDSALTCFPRAYLDADIILGPLALREVYLALQTQHAAIASPHIRFMRKADWITNHVAAAVQQLPPFVDDVVGGGFYAVNESGRARWDQMPQVIADDAFVLGHFSRAERVRLGNTYFCPRFPTAKRLRGVLRRWRSGRQELARMGRPLHQARRLDIILRTLQRPDLWLSVFLLACAKLISMGSGNARYWTRAD